VTRDHGQRVEVFRHIDQVDRRLWDSILGPDDLLMSHAFVKACQDARIANVDGFWHVLVSRDGQLVCTATLHRMAVCLELLSSGLTRRMVAGLKAMWPAFLRVPVLFCGLPVSCGQPCLKIAGCVDPDCACDAIAGTMEAIAESTATPLVCLKEFDAVGVQSMDAFTARGYFRAPSLPSCSMPLRWPSFDAYVGSLRSGYRRQLLATLRAREKAQLRVVRLDRISAQIDTIFPLYLQTVRRAPHRLETLNADFFRQLDLQLADRTRAIVIEAQARPVGAAVMLLADSAAIFLFVGMDDSRNPQWQVYQNLVAEVVAIAIESGARRLEMGQTSYEMKTRMGAEEDPRSIYLRYRGAMAHAALRSVSPALFPTHRSPQRRVFAR